jgi:hypothetical protein
MQAADRRSRARRVFLFVKLFDGLKICPGYEKALTTSAIESAKKWGGAPGSRPNNAL